eukprot:scaffold232706_cov21-Tisochrysis_lutea.AAC.2
MHFCGCVYSARSSHSRTAQSKKAHLPAPALDSPSTQQPAGTPNAPEGVRWKGKFSWTKHNRCVSSPVFSVFALVPAVMHDRVSSPVKHAGGN